MMKQTRCYGCDKPIEPEWLTEGEFIVCDECSSDTDKLSVEKLIEKEIKDYEVSYKISGRGSGNYIAGILEGLKIARAHAIDSLSTDEKTVEKLQEELESCIQTLIEASAAANITQDIVVGNLVDRKLADLAKTHKLAVDYIEKVTGKNIHVVLAENAALEAEEDE
ncbi:hypothetical protein [Lactococcus lactis]|uniref:hypothetical protein n=1 Tax=Lactococcus lactis TaxID=1358 RepID=UPI003FD54DF6